MSLIRHSRAIIMSGYVVQILRRFEHVFCKKTSVKRRELAAFLGAGLGLVCANVAPAAAQVPSAADGLSPLLECRRIEDRQQRVECYDGVTDRLAAARTSGEIVVVERSKVTELKRQLFGFAAPALGALLGGGEADADRVEAIETTLDRAVREVDGKWRFHLADGSQWAQVDFDPVRFQNRPGQLVRIRRAALGSYMLTTGNSRAVRVQRY